MIYNVMLVRQLNVNIQESMLVYTTNIEEKFNEFIGAFVDAYENVGIQLNTSYKRGNHIETLWVEIR